MTTFLCHMTTSFGHHVISFLQPTVQNSNGGFTTLVILIVMWIKEMIAQKDIDVFFFYDIAWVLHAHLKVS